MNLPNEIKLVSIFKKEDNQTVLDNSAMIMQLLDQLRKIEEDNHACRI